MYGLGDAVLPPQHEEDLEGIKNACVARPAASNMPTKYCVERERIEKHWMSNAVYVQVTYSVKLGTENTSAVAMVRTG